MRNLFLAVLFVAGCGEVPQSDVNIGSAQIEYGWGGSVVSLRYMGKEWVSARDMGREIQSAASFDNLGECFNPTQAGSIRMVESRLQSITLGPVTRVHVTPAFWWPPETPYTKGTCGGTDLTVSQNKTVIAEGYDIHQVWRWQSNPLRVEVTVTFDVPREHKQGQFEALTIYSPASFDRFVGPDGNPIRGQGEQGRVPIMTDGEHAVKLECDGLPYEWGGKQVGYGVFNFPDTNKINGVFRERGVSKTFNCSLTFGRLSELVN